MKPRDFLRFGAATGFTLLFLMLAGSAQVAKAGLSEADRITLEQPACAQMKSFSQDITLLNDEMQNLKRSRNKRRICDVTGRAVTTIGSTVGYMQSHIGECTITVATIDQMAALGRDLESDRRRVCR
jgi:hypothetical protein